jgi:hypothetical protein
LMAANFRQLYKSGRGPIELETEVDSDDRVTEWSICSNE